MAERKITGTHIVFALVVCVLLALLFVPIGPKPKAKLAKDELPAASAVAVVTDDSVQVPLSLQERYRAISKAVNIDRVKETVYTLGSYESRMVGYEGNEKAAQYVKDQFEKIGLKNVRSEGFKVTVPIDQGSSITVNGQTFPIYSIWPNLVRTSQVPPEGLKCHLIDAGKGKLPDFDGKKVNGSAAIVDFNSGTEWLNAPRLGAKALLFVEPERTMRGEGEAKFSAIPVSMPRFWVKKADAEKLKSFIAEGKADNVVIKCKMPWEKVDAENIVGFIEGTVPKLKDEIIVIHSHYDATSIVPALAPGAEGSCGIAALLEIARIFKQPEFAPRRSVMFIATSAHYQGLAGMRNFIESHIENYRQPSSREKVIAFIGKYFPENQNHSAKALIPTIAVFLVIISIANYIRKKLSNAIRKHKWLWLFPGIFALAALVGGYITFSQLSNGVSYKLPNPPKFYVWSGLDLSSQSEGVGIFYKGYFYDYREDIQGKFSDLAGRSRENAERVAQTLGFADQKDIRFADGVNPVRKNWRNFVPGKFALDSEVVTLAGGRGVSFVTIDDGRHLLDTPLDTIDKINFDNLHKQIEMITCIVDHWFRDSSSSFDEEIMKAKVVDSKTIEVSDPILLGYVQGVFTNPSARGKNYIKVSKKRSLPLLKDNQLELTSELPSGTKEVYILHQPYTKLGITEPNQFSRMGLQGGFAKLTGRVVMYDPRKSFVPDREVEDCLFVVRSAHKSFMGVRANFVDKTANINGKKGVYIVPGVAPLTAYGGSRPTSIGAYKLDPVSGDIIASPDMGDYGSFYPTSFDITSGIKEMPTVVFHCRSTSLYELIDPQSLRALPGIEVYEGDTNAAPKQYGAAVAVPEPQNPHVEDMAVIFTEDTAKTGSLAVGVTDTTGKGELKRIRIKLIMRAGPAATRLLLLNSDKDNPEGIGYDFTDGGNLLETGYKVANDMWTLDEYRLSSLENKGITNDSLRAIHDTSKRYLDLATKAKDSLNYSVFDSYSRTAWAYACRAYPDIAATAQDVVNGVIFYMFLMLPFAYFCERLFFASPELKYQLLWFFVIFIATFVIFKLVHPAFQVASQTSIVLIAFVMLALSFLTIFIVSGKFEEQLKQFNKSVSGVHKADIGRMSVAAAAFSLGISNMRRRKARTVLTCVTLILLTFTVLSFTSIVSELKFNKRPAKKDDDTYVYNGILLRTAMWDPMQEISYRLLKDEFGNEGKKGKVYPVAPRSWFYGTVLGEQSFLTLRRGNKSYDARAACGMMPEEAEIMDLNTVNKNVIIAGNWFGYKDGKRVQGDVDPYSIIITDEIAKQLEITPEMVGSAKVQYGGAQFTVVAILSNDNYKRIKDLDNELLTPVDFILMNKMGGQQQQQGADAGFREYTHLEPNNMFILPYNTLMNMGGDVRSIAVKFGDPKTVQEQLDTLMYRLSLNLYAGIDGSIYRYSSISGASTKGFSNVFIPILIAALIVLNTMLGSVFERVREIGIFSSIGLAPNHIAVLFIAESMVYANLGAVAGYVLGQAISKLISMTGLLPGLYLNFSSSTAVTSSLIVVGTVLLSTLYPARKASEVATPSVDRTWKVPEPNGDEWKIVLPFAVTGEQASGVNGFLKEWFLAYEEYSIGDFVTQDVKTGPYDNEYGKGYTISCKAWLAPFDLGVSQEVELRTEATSMEDVYEVRLIINRTSGDVSNWKRVNRRFLNTLRKQFLIWRTLGAEERDKYLKQDAKKDMGKDFAPAT